MENEGTRVISVFLVIFLAAAIIGAGVLLIYFLVYKLTINKAVTAQSGGIKHKMPAPSSAAKTVIAVALTVLIVAVWIDIRSLKDAIENIGGRDDSLSQRVIGLESEIYSLNEKLNREQSIFTKVDISYGKLDIKNHSVKISVSASPKSCTEEAELNIILGDNVIGLSKVGAGLFSGEIEVDLYGESDSSALITLTDEGKTLSEELYLDSYDIREKYGAMISSHIDNFIDFEYRSGRLDMKIYRLMKETEEFFVRDSFKLVVEVEGSVVLEDSLSLPDSYSADMFSFEIGKSCEIPNNAYTDIYISAVDKCGNTHICEVLSNKIPEEGYMTIGFGGAERVYDSTGNLIAEFSY